MADMVFAGDAPLTAEVATVQITAYDAATTYKLTLNGKTVSAVGVTDTTATATALKNAWNASTEPEFAAVTATSSTSTITLTADTSGVPFAAHLTSSVTGGTGTIGSIITSTAADGPSVCSANNFKNLSSGARSLPTNSDNLYFMDSDVDLKYTLEAMSAVTLASLHIKAGYTGQIGLPLINESGATDYNEYRPRSLKVGATVVQIGEGEGDGSDRLQLDLTNVQTTVTVVSTGTAVEEDYYPLVVKGTHASNVLRATGGETDVAPYGGDAATFATILATGDATIRCSDGCTLTTVSADGESTVRIESAATTVNCRNAATLTVDGSGAVTTLNALGGTTNYNGSGTITTLNIGYGATWTAEGNAAGCTVTNCNVEPACTLSDPNRKVTFTNAISQGNAGLSDWTLDIGKGRTVLPGAP